MLCTRVVEETHESKNRRVLQLMDDFLVDIHPFIEDIIDVKIDL